MKIGVIICSARVNVVEFTWCLDRGCKMTDNKNIFVTWDESLKTKK